MTRDRILMALPHPRASSSKCHVLRSVRAAAIGWLAIVLRRLPRGRGDLNRKGRFLLSPPLPRGQAHCFGIPHRPWAIFHTLGRGLVGSDCALAQRGQLLEATLTSDTPPQSLQFR